MPPEPSSAQHDVPRHATTASHPACAARCCNHQQGCAQGRHSPGHHPHPPDSHSIRLIPDAKAAHQPWYTIPTGPGALFLDKTKRRDVQNPNHNLHVQFDAAKTITPFVPRAGTAKQPPHPTRLSCAHGLGARHCMAPGSLYGRHGSAWRAKSQPTICMRSLALADIHNTGAMGTCALRQNHSTLLTQQHHTYLHRGCAHT